MFLCTNIFPFCCPYLLSRRAGEGKKEPWCAVYTAGPQIGSAVGRGCTSFETYLQERQWAYFPHKEPQTWSPPSNLDCSPALKHTFTTTFSVLSPYKAKHTSRNLVLVLSFRKKTLKKFHSAATCYVSNVCSNTFTVCFFTCISVSKA